MRVVTPERMRQIEGYAINTLGIDGLLLMEHAALALAREIRSENPRRVLAVCGAGNNGGDAYACTRMLHLWGFSAALLPLCPMDRLHGDALKNAQICQRLGIPFLTPDQAEKESFDLVIDGIFGTGLSRKPEGEYARTIEWINTLEAKKYCVDIPSGVDGETGHTFGIAVRGDVTVTFQWAKRGHYLASGPEYTGHLVIKDIGIPEPEEVSPDAEILTDSQLYSLLPVRPRNAYKNQFGHALLAAGSRGMAGAAVLAASACMRSGAGLLSVCAPESSVIPHLQNLVPAAMGIPLREDHSGDAEVFSSSLPGKTAVGCGCGLGRRESRAALVRAVLESDLPVVLDADGLYHAAAHPDWLKRAAPTVLTPHPGEMARLSGIPASAPVNSPIQTAQDFAAAHHCVVLLKGACTAIAAPDGRLTLNVNGTSGMATAGSGDTLTGIILALLAQGMSAYDAARCGAYLHGAAGCRAEALYGNASMNAMDIAQNIRLP